MRAGVFLVVAMTFALPCMVAATLVASADEGSPAPTGPVSPRLRPPSGVLRHVDAPTATPALGLASNSKELVVLVGGYQSCACPDDGTFDPLRARLAAMPDVDVVR